jgi:uncharacterized membrane protein YphA (DoxX/SURF4 family)
LGLFPEAIDEYSWGVLRLFSMFPTGAPGIALLLLRISLAAAVLDGGPSCLELRPPKLVCLALAGLGVLLCLGLVTPIISAILCGIELVVFFAGAGEWRFFLLVCPTAVALAMLGPGAYSVDAKLFGRREVVFPPGDRRSRN